MQQRSDKDEAQLELWWPTPPRQLDPVVQLQQLQEAIQRRRLAQREHDRALDLLFRGLAQRSSTSPPPTFTAQVRESLSRASIAPPAASTSYRSPFVLRPVTMLGHLRPPAQMAAHYRLTARQRRAALGSAGTVVLALLFGGLGVAVAPSEVLTILSVLSALVFSTIALGHILSAVVGALMANAFVAVGICVVYALLAVVWVRLVRHPLEA